MTPSPESIDWDHLLEQSAASFLAEHLLDPPADVPGDRAGSVIGRYRLIEEIGRGGMGVVWLADRADGQFEQRVALKLIKRGMDSTEIIARFIRERQILARLEHPHIARLLDGGVADDGRPYFVMEYIAGEPITVYCDRRRLRVDERLKLFVVTCRAVQFAHRSLVVHRDLKPSNVLVTERGEVKLLDFGVAKMLESGGDVSTAAVRAPMTPEYASPEQVAGQLVTTSSDVFQLGVLLYELLTGHRPWRTADRERAGSGSSTSDPPRPSTASRSVERVIQSDGSTRTIDPAQVSEARASTPQKLWKRLRGDLDSIVLTSLRREPDRRHPSTEALADEVERHLAGLPIRLRDGELVYRASRFVRRHRWRVAAAVVVVAAFVSSAAFYTQRIRRERDIAVAERAKLAHGAEIVRQMFADWNPDAANRGEVSAIAILRNAVTTTERELADQPIMLAASLSMLGELFTNIGDGVTADSLLTRALAIQADRDRGAAPADLAATMARRGRLFMYTRNLDRATRSLRDALGMHRALFGSTNIETLRVQRDLAVHLRTLGQLSEAESLLRDIRTALQGATPRSLLSLDVDANLGYVFFQQARYDDAVSLLRATLEQQRANFGSHSASVLLTTRFLASSLRDRGELDESERLYRQALSTAEVLYGPGHVQTSYAKVVLSILLERKGELEEAERLSREGIAILGSNNMSTPLELIRLGAIRLDRGNHADAERWLRLGLDSLRRLHPTGNADEADALNRLAFVLTSRGDPRARDAYREAAAFDRARLPGAPVFVSDGLHFLAWSHHRHGELAAAESTYQRALGLYRVQLPADHEYTRFAEHGLEQVIRERRRVPR